MSHRQLNGVRGPTGSADFCSGETGWVHGLWVVETFISETIFMMSHSDSRSCICFYFSNSFPHYKMPQEGLKIAVPFPLSTWPLYPLSLGIYSVFSLFEAHWGGARTVCLLECRTLSSLSNSVLIICGKFTYYISAERRGKLTFFGRLCLIRSSIYILSLQPVS